MACSLSSTYSSYSWSQYIICWHYLLPVNAQRQWDPSSSGPPSSDVVCECIHSTAGNMLQTIILIHSKLLHDVAEAYEMVDIAVTYNLVHTLLYMLPFIVIRKSHACWCPCISTWHAPSFSYYCRLQSHLWMSSDYCRWKQPPQKPLLPIQRLRTRWWDSKACLQSCASFEERAIGPLLLFNKSISMALSQLFTPTMFTNASTYTKSNLIVVRSPQVS